MDPEYILVYRIEFDRQGSTLYIIALDLPAGWA